MKRGSITIEACIIVPIMLLVLAVMVMTSLYLHDIIVLKSVNTLRGDHQVITGEHYEEKEDWIVFALKSNHKSQLTSKIGHDIYVSRLQGRGETSLPGFAYSIEDERNFKVLRPKDYVRMLDFMDDATDKIGYTKAIKEKIDHEVTSFFDLLNP
ncbi:TadE family protein [Petrocella sp. FN5]|uniref:TadE family protein n=1 Tax=Petrocella sp. FN5 TaxID=3032002 RepID=UPI0023DB913F|nr:TadE family protein [Petrocella sp. FN5]MDF1618373.1 pilus assembly protein [Petrocella sp. FN5]